MNKPFGELNHEPCPLLRWKAMFYDAESDPSEQQSNSQIYWCSETQVCIGPDGQVAESATCSPDRSCYQKIT